MISVQNLVRTYPGVVPTHALRGVTFDIQDGEFVALMGKSGSGKSTLLHQLGLLDDPTSGAIAINGVDVMGLSENEKARFRLEQMGYIFQEYALIAEFTALQNVFFPTMALSGIADKDRAKELLELVGLGHRLDHYPKELSGGEQQRVAIARALINNPKVLFADEATANLDSESTQVVLDLLRKLNREYGKTILMITHEPEDEHIVDRVIWLKDGMIVGKKD